MYEEMTERWVMLHWPKILGSMEYGYEPDRYSDKDIEDVVGMFDYYASPYLIGTSLFKSIMRFLIPHMYDGHVPYDQMARETDQIITFCKLGEYGQGFFTDTDFDSILVDLLNEYRSDNAVE